MSVKLLHEHHLKFLSLKEGCTGLSESTLVKMPLCWKSHVAAQIVNIYRTEQFFTPASTTLKVTNKHPASHMSEEWVHQI